jgi:hypothetical protein
MSVTTMTSNAWHAEQTHQKEQRKRKQRRQDLKKRELQAQSCEVKNKAGMKSR